MEFMQTGHKVTLRGIKQQGLHLIRQNKMQKLLQKPEQIAEAQLCLIRVVQDPTSEPLSLRTISTDISEHQVRHSVELEHLLDEYSDLFHESNNLPPERSHDHKITLNEGTEPINARPYRYPIF